MMSPACIINKKNCTQGDFRVSTLTMDRSYSCAYYQLFLNDFPVPKWDVQILRWPVMAGDEENLVERDFKTT